MIGRWISRCWFWEWCLRGQMLKRVVHGGLCWSLWLRPQKRSWIDSSPALFSKLLIRRCQIGDFKIKTCFPQKNYKSLAKATYWASSSSNLASTSCTHVCFVEFFILHSRLFSEMDLCSSVASTGGLGFPGGSLGWVRSRLVLVVFGRPLRPYLILVV